MTKVAVVSTVKAPLAQLKEYVSHTISIGMDRVCLFFDDPSDEAAQYFTDMPNVEVVLCSDEHWKNGLGERPVEHQKRQVFNINFAADRLKQDGFEWLISIDCDELLYPKRPLHRILEETTADALRFPILEAVSERLTYDSIFSPEIFKKVPMRGQGRLARLLGCRKAFFGGQYFRGHSASKMAVRMTDKVVEIGIHWPTKTREELTIERPNDLILLHFDCVGYDNWHQKWNNILQSYGPVPNPHHPPFRQKQFMLFCGAAEKGGDEAIRELYLELHTIPEKEKRVLRMLGLMTSMDLNDAYRERA